MSKQHLAALWEHAVLLAWVASVKTGPQTLAGTHTGYLLALSREQHMTVCPEGITACIVLISGLQNSHAGFTNTTIILHEPEGGKLPLQYDD